MRRRSKSTAATAATTATAAAGGGAGGVGGGECCLVLNDIIKEPRSRAIKRAHVEVMQALVLETDQGVRGFDCWVFI